jgi:hypothetical protein
MQYDVWMVTPEVDDNFYRASAAIAGAGPLTLLATTPGINGYGFKVTFEANSNTSSVNFTIVGYKVGDTTGNTTTEVVAGPNLTSSSTNYYSGVVSISASAATANLVKIGHDASLALPRTRIKGLYYVGNTNAGSLTVASPNRTVPFVKIITPTSSNSFADSLFLAAEGVLVGNVQPNDYATVTTSNVTAFTLTCG